MTFVACLCAEWCGACREYREVFDRVAREAPGGARFAWIDIEDRPEVMGEVDVESFPTLLIVRDGRAVFFGPVAPHAAVLASLLERAGRGELAFPDAPAVQGIARRAADSAGS